MKLADTTIVVLVPESGDAIQTMKAGLMEAADVFVVNKADRPGAPALIAELRFNVHLHLGSSASRKDVEWEIPVLSVEAQNGVGIEEMLAEVRRHRAALEGSGALGTRRRERRRAEFESLLVDRFRSRIHADLVSGALSQTVDRVADGDVDPYSAADAILANKGGLDGPP
jgi:LAO/AO transport system kinase